jgi:hypothetical protein
MINTLSIFHELEETLDSRAAEKIADVIGRVYEELQNTVSKEEFGKLTAIVEDLSEVQKRTETHIESLGIRVEELAEAQKRTETRVEELAEAQKRTETRVEELAEAQKRTETRVEELAEAQKRTEQTIQRLVVRVDDISTQLGGLSDSVGYGLENTAYRHLPQLLEQDFGIETKEPLYRRFVTDNTGNPIEVNICGAATQDGKPIHITGESKSQLSKNKIDEFIRKKLKRLEGVYPELFPIIITHMISEPDVAEYAEEQGIHLYYSYQFVES